MPRHVDFGGRVRSGISTVVDSPSTDDCDRARHPRRRRRRRGDVRSCQERARWSRCACSTATARRTGSQLIQGLDWVDRRSSSRRCRPWPISASVATPSTTVDDAVQALVDDGITVAVAAGNEIAECVQRVAGPRAGSDHGCCLDGDRRSVQRSRTGDRVSISSRRATTSPSDFSGVADSDCHRERHVDGCAACRRRRRGLASCRIDRRGHRPGRRRPVGRGDAADVVTGANGSPNKLLFSASPPPTIVSSFVSLVPARLLESRSGVVSTVDGLFNGVGCAWCGCR